MPKIRCFVAIAVPDGLKASWNLGLTRLRRELPELRWVQPYALHLTLHFLGHVEASRIPAVGREMSEVARGKQAFTFVTAGINMLPSRTRVKTIYLGLDPRTTPPLIELQAALASSLANLSLECHKRGFLPHITLGRAKPPLRDASQLDATLAPLKLARQAMGVEKVVLFRSVLKPQGSTYEVLAVERLDS